MRLRFVVSIINIINAATVHRFLCVLKNNGIYKDHKNVNVSLDNYSQSGRDERERKRERDESKNYILYI